MCKLALLILPCCLDAAFLGTKRTPVVRQHAHIVSSPALRQNPLVAMMDKPARAAARPFLVPALSYGGLAAVAVGAAKVVTITGYAGTTIMGVSLPTATAAAIAAPALLMYVEFRFGGGGERVAIKMGGAPADASLVALATDVANRAGLDAPAHVFEIPTDELNAFAAGFGSADATVAVTSGLRSALTTSELEAVIAHEIGHIRHEDMRTNMHVAVAIAGLGGIYEVGRVLAQSESSSDSDKDDDSGSVVSLGVAMMAGGMAARLAAHMLQLSMSRTAEYDADGVAAQLCGSNAMMSALKKIQHVTDQKARLTSENSSHGWSKSKPVEVRALSSFRGGAFAHSYISSGEATSQATCDGGNGRKDSVGSWWKGSSLPSRPTRPLRAASWRCRRRPSSSRPNEPWPRAGRATVNTETGERQRREGCRVRLPARGCERVRGMTGGGRR